MTAILRKRRVTRLRKKMSTNLSERRNEGTNLRAAKLGPGWVRLRERERRTEAARVSQSTISATLQIRTLGGHLYTQSMEPNLSCSFSPSLSISGPQV